MKLGIVQGRLLEPIDDLIQEFPYDNWEKELKTLDRLGLSGVEWIITNKHFEDNPIFGDSFKFFNLITSVCLDNLITKKIHDKEYLVKILEKLCMLESVKSINIPILEESSMEDGQQRKEFITILKEFGDRFPDTNFLYEAELGLEEYLEIIHSRNNFFATYDTGNLTSYGANHTEYINALNNKIRCVHIKDRNVEGETKELFQGDTDFDEIFYSLNNINYDGLFTLQLQRGLRGNEINTVNDQINKIKILHGKYFKTRQE